MGFAVFKGCGRERYVSKRIRVTGIKEQRLCQDVSKLEVHSDYFGLDEKRTNCMHQSGTAERRELFITNRCLHSSPQHARN